MRTQRDRVPSDGRTQSLIALLAFVIESQRDNDARVDHRPTRFVSVLRFANSHDTPARPTYCQACVNISPDKQTTCSLPTGIKSSAYHALALNLAPNHRMGSTSVRYELEVIAIRKTWLSELSDNFETISETFYRAAVIWIVREKAVKIVHP